jgi:quinol monooxygenase YgiN
VINGNQSLKQIQDKKIYLLAEFTILPGFLKEVKATRKEALIPRLQEPGCEAPYETGRNDDPNRLVFFEVFSSAVAHVLHLAQDYTKRMFASLDGNVSGVTTWIPARDLTSLSVDF